MTQTGITIDTTGSVTSPKGFTAGGIYTGVKSYGETKLDLGMLASDRPCSAAGTFTKNRFASACVVLNRRQISDGVAQAVVVNSGIANSSTGERGLEDAHRMSRWTAARLGVTEHDVLVCSTGVIGVFLPMEKIEPGVHNVELSAEGGEAFARAIMTTDTRPKHASVRFGEYTLGGCIKGAGMIHPNMATTLAFLTTDAPVAAPFLQTCLSAAVEKSFNLVSIDGDTSPSDTALLLANGAGGGEPIHAGDPRAAEFAEALEALCIHLAQEMARDAEGATRIMEIEVTGAASIEDARHVIRLVSTSYLVKSAVHGADPNWGRIVTVLGRSGVAFDEQKVTVQLCGYTIFQDGAPHDFDSVAVSYAMQGDTVPIAIDLGAGEAAATGWGCDLSPEYVHINADYTT